MRWRCLSWLCSLPLLALGLLPVGTAATPAGSANPAWREFPLPRLESSLPSSGAWGGWSPAWALRIENRNGGGITLLRPDAAAMRLGSVLRPARAVARSSFYAAGYGGGGSVLATSRKALRLRAGSTVGSDPSRVHIAALTLLPIDWRLGFESPEERAAIENEPAAARTHLWTDCAQGLFSEWAPPVGSPVYYFAGGRWQPLASWTPALEVPTELLVVALQAEHRPEYLELENWTRERVAHWRRNGLPRGAGAPDMPTGDGQALAVWSGAKPQVMVFGSVYQRVMGVGRLDDTGIAQPGQICTNHPGDVGIALSTRLTRPIRTRKESDQLAGFQILPVNHARDGMVDESGKSGYPIGATPWMIVGPPRAEAGFNLLRRLGSDRDFRIAPPPEGTAPLFAGFLSPRHFPEEDSADRVPDSRRGYLVRVSADLGHTWKRLPVLQGTAQNRLGGLDAVTNFRIYLPTGP